MSSLSCCHYTTRASLTKNNSSTPPETNNPKNPPSLKTKIPRNNKQYKSQHQKQLAFMEIERAIGAGTFRDTEPRDLDQQKKVVYNGVLPDFSGIFEGPVEKQLRATGEWFISHTEKRLRSSRKGILMLVIKWILPIWTLSLLMASGVIKLPFSIPFIDNLIM